MRILVADDDPQILRALRITLAGYDYEVVTAADGASALRKSADLHPDLVLLDLGMPRFSGFEVIEGLRGWSRIPILVISGRTDSADKVRALDLGADDYVTKPFSTEELLARIRALTRRTPIAANDPVVAFADITADLSARQVIRQGRPVRLTPTEWRLLDLLVSNPGKLISQQTMLAEVWGPRHTRDTGYLRLYIGQLRKKLEPDPAAPRYFVTEPGMGYRYVPDPVQAE
ncbi:response regulator [Arthrobacter sp. I2-34]|uniref:Response regulator n=1 Tax=Arthrobacter hankyongi TaxID=2904801 RepID=A0ABS9LAY9_9MICC|nr:response regulator [Arthrobacter hankyongi]MCG2623632.1 response regulator [Arthrobacter hankyongi]